MLNLAHDITMELHKVHGMFRPRLHNISIELHMFLGILDNIMGLWDYKGIPGITGITGLCYTRHKTLDYIGVAGQQDKHGPSHSRPGLQRQKHRTIKTFQALALQDNCIGLSGPRLHKTVA